MKYAVIGREGRYHFGGTSITEFETWQKDATLYKLTYPKRDWQNDVTDLDDGEFTWNCHLRRIKNRMAELVSAIS